MPETTLAKAEMVICVMSHMSGPNAIVCNEGELLRADDPRVLAAPMHFRPKDTPRNEWPTPFDTSVAMNDQNSRDLEAEKQRLFEEAAKANKVKLEPLAPVATVRAKKDVITTLDGVPTTIQRGSVLAADHPAVLDHPGDFS